MAFEKTMGENAKHAKFYGGSNFVPKTISDILEKVSLIPNLSDRSSELDFFLRSLEDEMRKVDAFKRELPLCMQLLKDGIERLKGEKVVCEERESGPLMEEESTVSKSNSEGDKRAKTSIDFIEKRNWMSSVQLWTTPPLAYETGGGFLSSRGGGGAFSPFKKQLGLAAAAEDQRSAAAVEGLSLWGPVADVESINVRVDESRGLVRARLHEQHRQQPQRKQRRCWSPNLHRLFVDALQNLGGPEVATPKQIREHMKVEGLTNDEVKSHLQDSHQEIFERIAHRPTGS